MELHVFVTHTAAEYNIMGCCLVQRQMWHERNPLLASRHWLDCPCEKVKSNSEAFSLKRDVSLSLVFRRVWERNNDAL